MQKIQRQTTMGQAGCGSEQNGHFWDKKRTNDTMGRNGTAQTRIGMKTQLEMKIGMEKNKQIKINI